jgi:hypothetical protein
MPGRIEAARVPPLNRLIGKCRFADANGIAREPLRCRDMQSRAQRDALGRRVMRAHEHISVLFGDQEVHSAGLEPVDRCTHGRHVPVIDKFPHVDLSLQERHHKCDSAPVRRQFGRTRRTACIKQRKRCCPIGGRRRMPQHRQSERHGGEPIPMVFPVRTHTGVMMPLDFAKRQSSLYVGVA